MNTNTGPSFTRRGLLGGAVGFPALFQIIRAAKPTDIRVESIHHTYEQYKYRVPIKFGAQPTMCVRAKTQAQRRRQIEKIDLLGSWIQVLA